jgi:signal transduction histidine kinase
MIAMVIGAYVVIGVATLPSNDVRFFLLRTGILALISLALLFRTRFELRVRRDVEKLAAWPRTVGSDRETAVRELLTRAADVLQAPRAALVWTEADGFFVAQYDGEALELEEDEPEEVVLTDTASFMSRDVRSEASPLAPSFIERLDVRSVIAVRLSSETAAGWLFLLDHRSADADDLALAEIVGRLVTSGLDHLNLTEMMRRSAAAEERVRLARDLHDGLLQSLTGLGLQAEGARRMLRSDPQGAERRLDVVVDQLAREQSALREFVDELRPERASAREVLRTRLAKLAADLARQWSVTIDLEAAPGVDTLPDPVAASVVSLAAESLANAGKHAAASRIRAAVAVGDGWVSLHVEDDGRGFPFHGRFALRDLDAEGRGPASIRERVAQLGGEMTLDTSPAGSRLQVRLPVG